jgi:hypothetical protein
VVDGVERPVHGTCATDDGEHDEDAQAGGSQP